MKQYEAPRIKEERTLDGELQVQFKSIYIE